MEYGQNDINPSPATEAHWCLLGSNVELTSRPLAGSLY